MSSAGYVFADRDLDAEFARLDHQASFFDPVSRARLERLAPVGTEARWLEVGVGTGSMTRWLAERGCAVLGLDISDRFFPAISHPRIELRRADVREVDLPAEFDGVYLRMVLHHLAERDVLVERLVGLLKPGGSLLIEEPHFDLASRISGPPFERVYHDIARRMLDLGVDYNFGGRLPALLRAAGLVNVDAAYSAPIAFSGSPGASYILDGLRAVAPLFVAKGWYSEAYVEELEAELRSDDLLATAAPIVSSWGIKPVASSPDLEAALSA